MFESIMNINPWVLGIIVYFCTVMPLIFWFGGCMRKHQNCDMQTGESLD